MRKLKSHAVAESLGQRIVSGKLAAGEILPTEGELSLRHGVSRASLREALKTLASKGLVEGRTRRGTAIRGHHEWNVLDADVLRWISKAPPDPAFFMELLEVRTIFEPAAARIAASRATPAQVLAIGAAFKGMADALPADIEGCVKHDLAFHEAIIQATGNPLLIRFADAIRTALLTSFRLSSNAREGFENSLAEHQAVAVAIRRRDPEGAERAMRSLLEGTARDLAPGYERAPKAAKRKRRA